MCNPYSRGQQFVHCTKACCFCTLLDSVSFGKSKLFNSLFARAAGMTAKVSALQWSSVVVSQCRVLGSHTSSRHTTSCHGVLPPHCTQTTIALRTMSFKNIPKWFRNCCIMKPQPHSPTHGSSLQSVPPSATVSVSFQTSVVFTTTLWYECETFLQYLASFLKVICQSIWGNTAVMAVSLLAD